ncbi:hypothetical protein [Reyranella sp.]|uniref:hypothetical protein n=1 Tax=Reyranella sp. TaxID=1929291 RepID=UPI0037845F0B
MERSHDVVIIGGGIAGAALAAVLARDLTPVDRVRGEYAPPWGVAELKRLALLDRLLQAHAPTAHRGETRFDPSRRIRRNGTSTPSVAGAADCRRQDAVTWTGDAPGTGDAPCRGLRTAHD